MRFFFCRFLCRERGLLCLAEDKLCPLRRVGRILRRADKHVRHAAEPLFVILSDRHDHKLPGFQGDPAVRTAITTNLFPSLNAAMTDTIAHLRTYTQSDFDSGK